MTRFFVTAAAASHQSPPRTAHKLSTAPIPSGLGPAVPHIMGFSGVPLVRGGPLRVQLFMFCPRPRRRGMDGEWLRPGWLGPW